MSTTTARVGLKRPVTADGFTTADYQGNLDRLDLFPGVHMCTSTTRPGMGGGIAAWGSGNDGQFIFETNTLLLWRWKNSVPEFQRVFPTGTLGRSEISADVATASTTPVSVISCAVVVPATHGSSTTKRIKIHAEWYAVDNGTSTTLGASEVSIARGAASTTLSKKLVIGRPQTAASPLDWGPGGSIEWEEEPGPGSFTYYLSLNALTTVGGTSTLRAGATYKAYLSVAETGV